MTIIVGVETTVKPYASVIAADTLTFGGFGYHMVLGLVNMVASETRKDLIDVYLGEIEKNIPLSRDHKIYVSSNQRSLLAYSGTKDNFFESVKGFLFEGPTYLETLYSYSGGGNPLLDIISDFCYRRDNLQRVEGNAFTEETQDKLLKEYLKTFSLEKRLLSGFVPEIPRIAAIMNREHLGVNYGVNADSHWYDKPRLDVSEGVYLFSTIVNTKKGKRPLVFPIRSWGVSRRVTPFSTHGSGRVHAWRYLSHELGLKLLYDEIDWEDNRLKINRERAIELACGAVKAASNNDPLIDGLDYVVLTEDGVEKHFSDGEQKTMSIDVRQALLEDIENLGNEYNLAVRVARLLYEREQEKIGKQLPLF